MPTEQRNEPERLWTAEEVAAFIGLHVQTVYEKARAGEIPSVKLGGSRRFDPAEVRAWVDAQKAATVTAKEPAA